MGNQNEQSGNVSCGCGCMGCLVEVIAFILICSIFGCEWARRSLHDCTYGVIEFVHKAWDSTGGAKAEAPYSNSEEVQ